MSTSTTPFRAATRPEDLVTLLTPLAWSAAWSGTSDHIGLLANRDLAPIRLQTTWSSAFVTPAVTAAEEVARLRDRIGDAAGLTKQEIARAIGVDRRSLSGFATGEIRPTDARLQALQVLAEAAEWTAARYGARARDVLREDSGHGAPLDLIALGRSRVLHEIDQAADALGLVRRGVVTVRSRRPKKEPLYLKARQTWADRIDRPTPGGRVRDPSVHEQDLSAAPRTPTTNRPRRREI